MQKNHSQNDLEKIAKVIDTHKDFDGVLAHYTGKIIAPLIKNKRTLEAGCSTGVITESLLSSVEKLDIVEGSLFYANLVSDKFGQRVNITNMLFEDFLPERLYESVVLSSVLHYFYEPVKLLSHIESWLLPGGELHITVPNMKSFHRELGVAMGMNKTVYEASQRTKFAALPGKFEKESLINCVESAGFKVEECYGFFFKPFPHETMETIKLQPEILDGLFKMGLKYPELACQLYIRGKKV